MSYNRKQAMALEPEPGILDSNSAIIFVYMQELAKIPCKKIDSEALDRDV